MMKNVLLIALSLLVSFSTLNAAPKEKHAWKAPVAEKYLVGAVPVVDGKVVITRAIELPAALAGQTDTAYEAAKAWLTHYYNEAGENMIARKSVLTDATAHHFAVEMAQYIYFVRTVLVTDFSKIFYTIDIKIDANNILLSVSNISYRYDEERNPMQFTAEEQITDQVALKNGGKKFYPNYGKFRTQTIDTIDELAASLSEYLQNEYTK